jgi:hypothetical protein
MNCSRFAFVVGTAVLGLSMLTACGGGNSNSSGQSSTSHSLATAQADNLGTIVVDGTGRTLYVFDKDTASPPKSNCDGDCAAMWPPVPAGTGTPLLDGVDPSAVGSGGSSARTARRSPPRSPTPATTDTEQTK